MPTANEKYFDAQIQHAERVESVKAGAVVATLALYNSFDGILRTTLYDHIGAIRERGFDLSGKTERRLQRLGRDVYEARAEAYIRVEVDLRSDLEGLAKYEAQFHKKAIERSLPFSLELSVPSAAALSGLASGPFRGKPIEKWMGELQENEVSKISAEIRIGLQEGNSTDQIVRRVIGTRTNRYRDGTLNLSRNHLSTITRTAVAHVASASKEAFYQHNPGVAMVQYVALLDGRTTLRCISLDGNIYPIGEGPRPPQHPNCRSQTVGVFDVQSLIGDRTYITDTRGRKQQRVDFRSLARDSVGDAVWRQMGPVQRGRAVQRQRSQWAGEAIGKAPKKTNYRQWFDRQPEWFQKERLGPARFKVYKEGVPLERFVDHKGHKYSLKELQDREREAFERVGLDIE